MQFEEIIGLGKIKNQLTNSYQKGKTAHAQLFLGREGGAGLSMAIAYASYLHCEDKKENDSCGVCPSCIKMKKLIHPDLHFLYPSTASVKSNEEVADPFVESWRQYAIDTPYGYVSNWAFHAGLENKQLSISANPVRAMMKRISLKAFESKHKIVIIWLAEYMNATSANAILKVLEEPTDGTIFLLVAQDINKILTTIKSRCQLINIPTFLDEDIKEYLDKHYSGVDPELINTSVRQSEGNLQDAISKVVGTNTDYLMFFRNWMRLSYSANFGELVQLSDEFQQMGKLAQSGLIDFGLFVLRRSLLFINSVEQNIGSESSFIQGFSKTLNHDTILKFTELLNTVSYHLERNASPRITFLNVSIQLAKIFRAQ